MHQISAILLALLFLVFTGCEDKKPEQNTILVENTTVVVKEEKQEKEIVVKELDDITAVEIDTPEETNIKVSDTFHLFDTQKKRSTVTVTENGLLFQDNTKPIVLLQLFATWCAPCIGEIAYLNDLQAADNDDLFVAGILTRDTIDTATLNTFTEDHHINYQILQNEDNDALSTHIARELNIQGTFPIPLIVIYLNGKYYTHYEGSIPVEMIKYDIKQAKQQLQKNEDQR